MKHLRTYLYAIAPEAMIHEQFQRGALSVVEAEEQLDAARAARTETQIKIIRDFRAEAKRTVYHARKAGLLPKQEYVKELAPL